MLAPDTQRPDTSLWVVCVVLVVLSACEQVGSPLAPAGVVGDDAAMTRTPDAFANAPADTSASDEDSAPAAADASPETTVAMPADVADEVAPSESAADTASPPEDVAESVTDAELEVAPVADVLDGAADSNDVAAPDSASLDVAVVQDVGAADADEPFLPADPASGLTLEVHEWGTFTEMQGSDGKALPGMHHDEAPLPGFVHTRADLLQAGYWPDWQPVEPNHRLETPVLYFHTAKPLEAKVVVGFPAGIVSHWFPQCSGMLPELYPKAWGYSLDGAPLENGEMTWQIQVSPKFSMAAAPQVAADSIWAPSRNVDASPVRSQGDGGWELDRFIFYRGAGVVDMPVHVTSDALGIHVANGAAEPVPLAFLVTVTDQGTAALAELGPLPAKAQLDAQVPALEPMATFLAKARPKLQAALVGTGLYADEAWAMVDTWTSAWLTTPGVRVLYLTPQPWYDALLPTAIEPKPAFVRTLVGRIEILTPAAEAAVMAQVQALSKSDSAPQCEGIYQGFPNLCYTQQPLKALQPLAEPKLARVCPMLAKSGPWTTWQVCQDLLYAAHIGP